VCSSDLNGATANKDLNIVMEPVVPSYG